MIGGGPRKRVDTTELGIQIKGQSIQPSLCVKWLGVWLDFKLSFKQHVQEWCGKAQRITQLIRHINMVQRGVDLGPMIKVVQSCVLSTALYVIEA